MNTKTIRYRPWAAMQQILDLLYPPRCAGCQRSGHILCPSCLAQIQPLLSPFCQHCSAPLSLRGICQSCQYRRLNLSGLRAVSIYQEPLRACIHALKYSGNTRLAGPLGQLLAQAALHYRLRADLIIPVPLHSEREKQRGYNHALLLAEVFSRQAGIPLQPHLLVRQRATRAQVDLSPRERWQNVAGAFSCQPAAASGALAGRKILVVDDVCTTGATLEACAAPLFAAGAQAVWGLVLARPRS